MIEIKIEGFTKSEAESVQKCLKTLYSVRAGEQPLDREFGLDQSFLDQPPEIAKNLLTIEILEKTKRYEPRAKVEEVTYRYGTDGDLIPVVHVKKGEA